MLRHACRSLASRLPCRRGAALRAAIHARRASLTLRVTCAHRALPAAAAAALARATCAPAPPLQLSPPLRDACASVREYAKGAGKAGGKGAAAAARCAVRQPSFVERGGVALTPQAASRAATTTTRSPPPALPPPRRPRRRLTSVPSKGAAPTATGLQTLPCVARTLA
jgi:hypothetical protein